VSTRGAARPRGNRFPTPISNVLPIEPVLPALARALADGSSAVLQAPPGAGKTTRVPLALLEARWLGSGRIVVLEPRRLAARAAAQRMAEQLGEPVGRTVGYRVRADTRVGRETRIEVVTEGVLTRMLQADPALEGVGLVVFDEFHERSIHSDLGLALCLQSRALLREELRILVMSATLDGEPVAALLGGAAILTSEGRAHPVDTRHLPAPGPGALEAGVERAVRLAVAEEAGDVLVFLPGAAEIRRVEARLREEGLGPGVEVLPLFGSLPQEAQDRAIAPGRPGRRKVVLATSIAETSLTIEGVRVVVDGGRMRVPKFSPRSGMPRLATVSVTRASADQRRGRAGRLGPGVCYRLWSAAEDRSLVPHGTPEILEADLAPLALELAVWGIADPAELAWLDPPPEAAFAQARELLEQLGALDAGGAVTAHGRRMTEFGTHPRLAHLLLRGAESGYGALACDLAALLGGRDVLRAEGDVRDADIRVRLGVLRAAAGGGGRVPARAQGMEVDRAGVRRVAEEARAWRRRLGVRDDEVRDADAAGLLLAFAYPDRIAQRRPGGGGRFLLRNGRGAALPSPQALSAAEFLVAAELDGRGRESRVFLAAPLERAELEAHFGEQAEVAETTEWDAGAGAVRARRRRTLGALTLQDAPSTDVDAEAVAAALLGGIREAGLRVLPWTPAARQLQQRLGFLHRHEPGWLDASEAALLDGLAEWLGPHLFGMRRLADLDRLDLEAALLAGLPWDRRRLLDEVAPTHLLVPSGSRIPLDYADPDAPTLAVRLQEVFGLRDTPRIARGAVPLTIHLLSPAHRPVQVTRDLASFWRTTYFEVRKDLRGRYPKHSWPDDPLAAEATRRARPR
jgi:ATP-dependent helicase HrpB